MVIADTAIYNRPGDLHSAIARDTSGGLLRVAVTDSTGQRLLAAEGPARLAAARYSSIALVISSAVGTRCKVSDSCLTFASVA